MDIAMGSDRQFVGKIKYVNTCLSAKDSGWPIIGSLSTLTIVIDIRDHASKT